MWKYMIEILAGLVSAAVIAFCWKQYDVIDRKGRKEVMIMAAVGILFVLLNLFMGRLPLKPWTLFKWEILLILCICTAGIDHRKKIIPNKLLLAALAARTLLFVPEFLWETEKAGKILIQDLIGAVVCFGVLFIACFLTKQQIGAGDVKLFGVIGYIFGIVGAYNTLFYAMLFALIYGVYHMLVHKESRQYKMAFAPFVCLGCICVLMMQIY